jgi:hypothetical protein
VGGGNTLNQAMLPADTGHASAPLADGEHRKPTNSCRDRGGILSGLSVNAIPKLA